MNLPAEIRLLILGFAATESASVQFGKQPSRFRHRTSDTTTKLSGLAPASSESHARCGETRQSYSCATTRFPSQDGGISSGRIGYAGALASHQWPLRTRSKVLDMTSTCATTKSPPTKLGRLFGTLQAIEVGVGVRQRTMDSRGLVPQYLRFKQDAQRAAWAELVQLHLRL
jgi:hypothetical protein